MSYRRWHPRYHKTLYTGAALAVVSVGTVIGLSVALPKDSHPTATASPPSTAPASTTTAAPSTTTATVPPTTATTTATTVPAGRTITLPGGSMLTLPHGEVKLTTVVVPGENLSEIAGWFKLMAGWQGLYAMNRTVVGSNPNLIYPGERLSLTVAVADIPAVSPVRIALAKA